jgi:hypothetical protein
MSDDADFDDEDDGDHWLHEGRAVVEQLLESLEFDPVTNEAGIVIPVRYKRDPTTWFASLDDIRDALVESGDAAASANVPFEGGAPVFSVDTTDVVDELLDAHGVVGFFESLRWADENDAEHLFRPSEYAARTAGGVFRIDLEEINAELIQYLARNPKKMHDLSPRKFEELVAELLRAKGYYVELTPSSGDGGKDIICTQKTMLGTMLIHVECKRFAADRPVGVEIVRSLYGVVMSDRASHGVLATTSSFTKGAIALHAQNKYQLSLHDFDALSGWLRNYRTPL